MVNTTVKEQQPISYSQVFYIDPYELRDNFQKGEWGYCEKEFYLRKEVNDKSVDEKKRALIFPEANTDHKTVEIIEACKVYTDKNGVKRFLSGNTRIYAVFALMAGEFPYKADAKNKEREEYKLEDFTFAPIPYQIVEGDVTYEVAAEIQISTNDFTNPHTPYEKAASAYKLRTYLFEKYTTEDKLNRRTASSLSTATTMKSLKISSEALISQYLTVMENPSFVHEQYLQSGKISIDTIVTMSQRFKKHYGVKDIANLTEEQIALLKTAYAQSYEYAIIEAQSPTGEELESVRIYRRHIAQYFDSLLEDTDEDDVEESEETTGEGTGEGTGEKSSSDKTVTLEQFKETYYNTINTIHSITDIENADKGLVATLLSNLLKTDRVLSALLDDNTASSFFRSQQDLFLAKYGNIEYLLERIQVNDYDLGVLQSTLNSVNAPAQKLWKNLYEPEQQAKDKVSNPDVKNEISEVKLNTDTHEAVVSELPALDY